MSRALIGLALLVGCYGNRTPISGDAGVDATLADGGVDARLELDARIPDSRVDPDVGVPSCAKRPPRRRDLMDGESEATVTFALRDIVFDQGDRWGEIGYDLDDRCTLAPTDEVLCVSPTGETVLDADGGVDNVFGQRISPLLTLYDPTFQEQARAAMEAGQSILVMIDGWNGSDDDPVVSVTVAQVAGVEGGDEPAWDGDDRWLRSADSYVGLEALPLIFDDVAYVSDGVLVARLPDRRAITWPWLEGNRFETTLIQSFMTGRLSADRQRLEEVRFVGRQPRLELDEALELAGICGGTAIAAILAGELDAAMDVRDPVGSGSPGAVCNSISLAFELTGHRALAGPIVAPSPPEPTICLP